ncbi:hypothetical protein C824_001481 [Schaedlerella arabinosiphila]|nr:hypothetical protein C824_001481 [Schaedlerella arabinosiphila]
MEKTVLMLRDEFSTNMANLLNETKLPLYVIEPILQNFLNTTRLGIQKQLERETIEYKKSLDENKKDCNESNKISKQNK